MYCYRVIFTASDSDTYQYDCLATSAKEAKETTKDLFYRVRRTGDRSRFLFEGVDIIKMSARKIPEGMAFVGHFFRIG